MPCLIKPDMHHTCCASCHDFVVVVYYVVCFFPVLLLRVGSGNDAFVRTRSSTSVCLLHGLVLLPCGISGKMTIPSKSLLSLLARCSLFCYAYATLPTTCYTMPPILPSQTSNHPFLANRWLAMLPLCSAPLIALLVAGEDWRPFLVGTLFTCWDIIILPCYLNASIYLVKGGRLGLSPSVLFHSCRPSFRHIGVMFPDFAFLTRLGYNGNPLIVRLD